MTSILWLLRRSFSASLGLALLVMLAASASAGPGASALVRTQGETAARVEAPTGYSSPRETLATFLREISIWRQDKEPRSLAAAVRALDLSSIPSAERPYNGQRFATQLVQLLDKIGMVDPDELPERGPDDGVYTHVFSRSGTPEVSLELEFRRAEDGAWLFSQGTLARLQGWTDKHARIEPLVGTGHRATPREWLRSVIPEPLSKRVLFLDAWQWIGLAVLVLAGLLAQKIVSYFFARFVAHASRSDRLAVDSKLLARVARPVALLATSIAFFLGVPLLDLDASAYHFVHLLANIGLTVALVWTAYRLVDVLSWVMAQKASQTDTKFDDMLVPLVRRTFKLVVVVLGAILMVTRLDSDLWGLVAGLSIGSLAVGFAAKDSIENLFGTFTVLMDKPFQLGDLILVNGVEGMVEDVGFRSTRLRTAEDSLITVPNSRFIAASVENRGLRRFKRVRATIGLHYSTPPEKIEAFCEGIRELIRRHPYTRKSDYHIWLTGFGASSLELQLTLFLEATGWGTESRERHRLFLDILRLAERAGVSFAYPGQPPPAARPSGADAEPEAESSPIDLGRRAAGEVARESLRFPRGQRPAPIRFDTQDADDAGLGRPT